MIITDFLRKTLRSPRRLRVLPAPFIIRDVTRALDDPSVFQGAPQQGRETCELRRQAVPAAAKRGEEGLGPTPRLGDKDVGSRIAGFVAAACVAAVSARASRTGAGETGTSTSTSAVKHEVTRPRPSPLVTGIIAELSSRVTTARAIVALLSALADDATPNANESGGLLASMNDDDVLRLRRCMSIKCVSHLLELFSLLFSLLLLLSSSFHSVLSAFLYFFLCAPLVFFFFFFFSFFFFLFFFFFPLTSIHTTTPNQACHD